MPLPEKDYFPLHAIALRWHIPLSDLGYYAMHNMLEIMVWLDKSIVNVFRLKKTEDGEKVPVPIGLIAYKDYAVLATDELRQIFRHDGASIRKFITYKERDLLEVHDSQDSYRVSVGDLVISRQERDRFETFYALTSLILASDTGNAASKPLSFAGRPSVMHRVRQCFDERAAEGVLLPSLHQEAVYLSDWAERHIKDGQPPKAKAIMNAIRADYRQRIGMLNPDLSISINAHKPAA